MVTPGAAADEAAADEAAVVADSGRNSKLALRHICIIGETIMNQINFFTRRQRHSFIGKMAFLAAGIFVFGSISIAHAQQSFETPEEAAAALASAVKNDWPKGVIAVLGPGGAEIVSSGDAVADENIRAAFLAAYDAKHQVSKQGEDFAELFIGPEDYPLPIPLVRKKGAWQFAGAAGKLEILYRRIGRNELATIQACLAYVDAQNDYAEKDPTGAGMPIYAQRIVSSPGKKDGLYWPGDDSPLGELVARATAEGYRPGGERAPFHGYYFKILTRQGASAPGGAMSYVVRGKMIGGFALVAYPAEYGNSGVMTFLVNHMGEVFQKDLGRYTTRRAARMTTFYPNPTWTKVVVNEASQ